MFINKSQINDTKILCTPILGIGIFFMAIWIFALSFAVARYIEGKDRLSTIMMFIALMVITSAAIIIPALKLRLCGLATKFSGIFENDADGIVALSYVSKVFGQSQSKLIKTFDKLLRKGYLKNCTLGEQYGEPAFFLSNGAKSIDERFKVVKCQHCGAFSEIKVGFTQACPSCGGPLESREKTYDVYLKSVGPRMVLVLKAVRDVTGLGLKEALDLVKAAPFTIKSGVSHEEAIKIEKCFHAAGATVEIRNT